MHDMMPQDNPATTPDAGHDREGAMAKADLFKLANYSLKLFKQIQDEDQLEAWVQAKITKAADYVASVYHYLEYEMKFSEYGEKLNDAEMYSEEQKQAIKNKLMEAKEKMKELKKAQAKKQQPKEVKEDEDRKPAKKQEREVELPSGAKVKATKVQGWQSQKADKEADKDRKKNDKVDESEDRPASKKKETTWTDKSGKKHPATRVQGSKSVAADKDADKERKKNDKDLDEGKGDGNLANNAKPYDKVTRGDVIAGRLGKDEKGGKAKKKDESIEEGKDEGKPGKNFAKIAKKAGEKYGSKAAGERVAGAVRNKLKKAGKLEETDKGDMDNDGKDEPDSKEYMDNKDNAIKKAMGKEKKVKEGSIQGGVWTADPPKKGEKNVPVPQDVDGGSAPAPKKPAAKPAPQKPPVKKAEAETDTAVAESVLKESAEVLRIKELTQRLLG